MPDTSMSLPATLTLVPYPSEPDNPSLPRWRLDNRSGAALLLRPGADTHTAAVPALQQHECKLFGKLMISELLFVEQTELLCRTSADSYLLLLVIESHPENPHNTRQPEPPTHTGCLLNPGTALVLGYPPGCRVMTLSIPAPELLQALAAMGYSQDHNSDTADLTLQLSDTDDALPEALYHILQAMRASASRPITAATRRCYEQLLYDTLLDSVTIQQQQPGQPTISKHPQIEQVRQLVMTHITEDFDLRDIASACKVSVKTLYNLFNRELGITPSVFIRHRKLEAAYADIQHCPEHNITHIATRYGFTNLSRFAAYFREQYGESPSETLRKRRQQDATAPAGASI
ncbi:helix-turn-helix domain-containing protein [Oceanobacter sp. 5_MG-2023]|uniref:helix-turn-helix domain-containing protein n=1 Tax=Oceanobacter sp. 5_MG-2023 TaxID=3062645 RepID=UPI0026E44666|nr:helix-turn-helix domain-containing protein [Oceanobacter sp. 5_MG-2023]MDO6683364.1 helix-turn-helix domain-containing protein [Oceanobacter sp. 5_MG-2023]